MNRQRGNIYWILALAIVAGLVLFGLVKAWNSYTDGLDQRGYLRGKAEVQGKWDAANLKAEQDKKVQAAAVDKALVEADIARGAAEDKAKRADQRWKEAVRESNRQGKPLATCDAVASTEPNAADAGGTGIGVPRTGVVGPRSVGPRFTGEFVRQYDSAWTGLDGEPVFQAADGGDGTAGPGAAWATAEEVRDIHAENARRCSTDRRGYADLINKVRAASAAFNSSGASR